MSSRADAELVLAREALLLQRFEPILHLPISYQRIRVHGDFHLGQVLYTGKDFVIIDYDGGRDLVLSERRRKRSALRDVAGMVRSLYYAAFAAILDQAIVREEDRAAAVPWGRLWAAWASASFLRGYLDRAGKASFLPHDQPHLAVLLDTLILQKTLEQLSSELIKQTDTVVIPLHGLARALSGA